MACILIVDDNPMILDMLTRRLERKGHQVIAVATGGEGIEAARQQNPDIILMDISLPDMDGLDAARLLKNDEKTRETPIIAHHRPHCTCTRRRPRTGPRGRLRRVRHQAHPAARPARKNRNADRPTGKLTSATGQIEQPDPLSVRDCRSGKL